MKNAIILASTSPRRQELLRQIGVRFEVIPSNVSEDLDSSVSPLETVRILAERKAQAVATQRPDALVIASDTVVSLDDKVLGKPHTPARAVQMLTDLSGRTHQVLTGVALCCIDRNILEIIDVSTDVTFGKLSSDVIDRYVATGEPLDKAGAYAIQGKGAVLVQSVNGSYYNIVGLPLFEVVNALTRYVEVDTLLYDDHG